LNDDKLSPPAGDIVQPALQSITALAGDGLPGWRGLVPRQNSSGRKERLGGIAKAAVSSLKYSNLLCGESADSGSSR
jgi:hypothetical protein